MAKGNRTKNRSGETKKINRNSKEGEKGSEVRISRAFTVLREGLREIDDAADLIRATLMDMESYTRPPSFTSQNLNGVGKLIKLKHHKDRSEVLRDKVKKGRKNPNLLPGNNRKFA